jgi:hypothetical protein
MLISRIDGLIYIASMYKGPFFSVSSPAFFVVYFLDDSHLTGVEMESQCQFFKLNFIILAVPGFELRYSSLLGRCSIT